MKRTQRKAVIAILLLALALGAWHFGLDRAADCWTQGGRWNWDNGFCRLDSLSRQPG